jgi:hypothetical protein
VINASFIFSPIFALAALISGIQFTNSLRYGRIRWGWGNQLRTRAEMPVRYWLVVIGAACVFVVSIYMLVEAFT